MLSVLANLQQILKLKLKSGVVMGANVSALAIAGGRGHGGVTPPRGHASVCKKLYAKGQAEWMRLTAKCAVAQFT